VTHAGPKEQRVALLSPTGRDAQLLCKVLTEAGIDCTICRDVHALCNEVRDGIGALLIAEEAIVPEEDFNALAQAIAGQPQWSDLPVMMLTTHGADSPTAARALEGLGNVMLLERPTRVGSLVSSARAALRARNRQHQIRVHIAEREKSEAALREADRRKDEFLATLAHELRNPLAPISNAAHILHMSPQGSSLEDARNIIERQVRHLARLVEDLLDVSRITRGKVELRRRRVDLSAVVVNAVETSQPLIAERGHEFALELPRESLPVDADPTRLAQVISNLLNNAAKYTPRGGRLSLAAAREGNMVAIRIKDDGIGIESTMLPKIFDMFVQVDNRLERATGGLGIGLTLVRHFVELHGGSVHAASGGPQRGSEFTIRLPLAEMPVAAAPDPPIHGNSAGAAGTGLRVVVVDDNYDNADTMSTLLRMLGNEVRVFNSGEEALERIAQAPPDVVLLDIGMPKMNGYEVAKRIRSQPGGQDIMLVAITGWGQEIDRVRSRAAGFDHHLVKPVDFDQLQRLLAERQEALHGMGAHAAH
jgi:signal transduction histidine kinase/ActR/RegA family two-component response regulator